MTPFSALAPWLVVLAIAVVGAATGVVVVRRVTPEILSAATTAKTGTATATGTGTAADGTPRGTMAAERDDPGAVVTDEDDSDGTVATTDENGTEDTEPAAMELEEAVPAVSRAGHVVPIAPETVESRTDDYLERQSAETTSSGASDTPSDVDRPAREIGSETSRTRAGGSLWGYVALGLGFLCLVGVVLFEGEYAEQWTVIGVLLYGLVLLVFYEHLGPATPTPAPSPVTERSDAETSAGESEGPGGVIAVPSRTDASAGSGVADRDGSGARPEGHEASPDDQAAKDRRPVAPEFPRWNENGTRIPAWEWSRTEHTRDPGGDVSDRDRLDDDEPTPDGRRAEDAEASDDDADDAEASDTDDADDAEANDADDADDADPDEASTRSEFACEYCGRDDFESAAQRNGHLRWCDEYDPNAPTAGDGEEAADATGASGGAVGIDDIGRSTDADTSGTEPTGAVDGTAEATADHGVEDAGTTADETAEVRMMNADTTVERDAAGGTIETDTREPRDGDAATVAGAASMENGAADERGDTVVTAPNTQSESGRTADDSTTSSTHTSDEQSIAVPASTVSTARRHLRAGRLDEAVYSAYRSVREELCARNDVPAHRTHREFSAACREVFEDDDSVEALDRLVDVYERLYYADETDADRVEIETLLDRLVDAESSRP